MVSINQGTQIDKGEKQSEKADAPRIGTPLPFLNVTLERRRQEKKQQPEIASIDEGIH